MLDRAHALSGVVDYLDRHAAEFPDDFTRKFRSRAEVIDDAAQPDRLVFEIERHRGIFGTCYKPGVPMSSFITYWPRYVFDSAAKKLERLGLIRPSKWTFGASADSEVRRLSFRFLKVSPGFFHITEQGSKASATVTHSGEAESFAAGLVGDWSLDRYLAEAADVLPPEQHPDYLADVKRELGNAARRRVLDYWELLLQEN